MLWNAVLEGRGHYPARGGAVVHKALFTEHLALFVRRMTQLWVQNHIGKYRHLVNCPWKWPREHTTVAVGRPDNKQNRCRTE